MTRRIPPLLTPHRHPSALHVAAAVVAALLLLGALAALAAYYYCADPSEGAGLACTFKALTGYDCPGCGAQRALHALLHGQPAQAWRFNPFIFFAVPIAAAYIVIEALRRRHPRLHAAVTDYRVTICIVITIVAYWIGRNL